MKKVIAVNQKAILSNKKNNTELPVVSVYNADSDKLQWEDGHEVIIYGEDGKEAAKIIYAPNDPWRNRAHVYIETDNKVDIIK